MTIANGEFELTGWNEDTYLEPEDGRKLTRASVTQDFRGDITGTGSVEWLMSYRPDGTAHFVGLQRIEGKLGKESGSFVVESIGDFDGKVAKGQLAVVPGSGTGDLDGIQGEGSFSAPMGSKASYSLDYKIG